MTGNRTTELPNNRVSRLLHEAGADFTVISLMRTGSMEPYDKFTVFDADKMPIAQIETSFHNNETVLLTLRCTPEQAVTATLGSGRLTAKQVRDVFLGNFEKAYETSFDLWEPSRFNWQAIADELDATLGINECDVSYEQDGIPRCSVCENVLYDEYKKGDGIKNYCDECGAKVRKAVKR